MKITTSIGLIVMAMFTVSAYADVLKLDCKVEYRADDKDRSPYMATSYMVDYHAPHGPEDKAAFVVGTGGSVGGDGVVTSIAMTSTFEDGHQRTIPGNAADAKIQVTDFVKVSESKVVVGDKRECPDADGKRCLAASYGYTLDLDKMTFVPEDVILYTYHCVENSKRADLPREGMQAHEE